MTTERWDDAKLDRLANAVDRNSLDIADMTRALGALIKVVEQDHSDIQDLKREMKELSNDNRGLQLEVRRLVEEMRRDRGGS